jgi:hypothetical protein
MAKEILYERLPMELNLGHPEQLIGWATISRDTETEKIAIEIELHETASTALTHFDEIAEIKALGFAGIIRRPQSECECGHPLSAHPPDPNRPFAWPCRICSCSAYEGPV